MFAVLDDRSINDSTVLLVKWEVWSERIDPNATSGYDDDSNFKPCRGWQTLRTYFADAADLMDALEYLPMEEHNSIDRAFDDKGVYVNKA